MINIIDIVLAVFILAFLLKNAGGISRTIKNLLLIVVFLIVFGLLSQFILCSVFAESAQKVFAESYFVKLSQNIIKWIYPPIKNIAPKIDAFVNDKIMQTPKADVALPTLPKNISLPQNLLLKENLPSLLKDK